MSAPPEAMPVVEPVGARQRQQVGAGQEPPLDPLDPLQRRPAVGVDEQQQRRRRSSAAPVRGRAPAPSPARDTTRTPGIAAAIAAVPSRLALSTTTISSGTRVWASSEWRHGPMNAASLCAQTMTARRRRRRGRRGRTRPLVGYATSAVVTTMPRSRRRHDDGRVGRIRPSHYTHARCGTPSRSSSAAAKAAASSRSPSTARSRRCRSAASTG